MQVIRSKNPMNLLFLVKLMSLEKISNTKVLLTHIYR